ncbi:MAG TPA: VOC family protein [Bryobacteraceae bacterium]|nr:VOC family protein [Bryobacteraceae bacterium]
MPDRPLIEQLDLAIDAILAGASAAAHTDPELAALARIARDLHDLPSEDFKTRLRRELERRASMTPSASAPIREGFRTVTPYIAVAQGAELIEFLKKTFGAEELFRSATPGSAGGFHAEVRIGGSMLMIGGGEALRGRERPGVFHAYVQDCDSAYHRAVDAGAVSIGELSDQPYGERSGSVRDAFGNIWYIATRFASTVVPEGLGNILPYLHPHNAASFIDFLKKAFGAEELARYYDAERVAHAAVRIGNSVLEMGEPAGNWKPVPSSFYMYVNSADAAYQRAITAGATSLQPPTDQPYGERTAAVQDPFGYTWYPATPL